MEAMGNQRTDAEPLTIKVDKRVVVPVDEIPNAICRDFLLQELPPGIDSRLAPCTSEDETTLLANRVERQIDAGVGSACVDGEVDATAVCEVADRGQGIGGSRVDDLGGASLCGELATIGAHLDRNGAHSLESQ